MSRKTIHDVLNNLMLTPEEEIYYADLIEDCKSREAILIEMAEQNKKNLSVPKIGSLKFFAAMEHVLALMSSLKEIIRLHNIISPPPSPKNRTIH